MSGNSWGAKHKGLLAIAGAAAATAMTMGAASPALAAALGGTAAAEGAGAAGGAAAGLGATSAVGPGLGAGLAAGFGPGAAGGGALAADAAGTAIPSITGAGVGTSPITGAASFGGPGLLGGSAPQAMYTAGLGTGSGGMSAPTFADKVGSFFSPDGGKYRWDTIKSGLGKVAKAQAAYKLGSGLLGGQPGPQGGGGVPPSQAFGARASPVNFSQFTSQPNSMMMGQQPQLPPQLAMLPPNDPRVLAYLQQMGGMYG